MMKRNLEAIMNDYQSNGHPSVQDLEQENARLRRGLAQVKHRQMCDRVSIYKLLGGGKVLSLEEVQERIAAGDPHRELLLDIEREMKEEEAVLRETMANPIP